MTITTRYEIGEKVYYQFDSIIQFGTVKGFAIVITKGVPLVRYDIIGDHSNARHQYAESDLYSTKEEAINVWLAKQGVTASIIEESK